MMIKVTDKYYIGIDKYCYTVQERSIIKSGKKQGEESFKPLSYFGDLKGAVHEIRCLYMKSGIMDVDLELKEAIDILTKLDKEFADNYLPNIPEV